MFLHHSRLISDSFYIPRIQHLVFDEKSRVDLSKDKNKMNVQWKINVPKRSSYLLIIGYKLQGNKDVNVDISILYSACKIFIDLFYLTKTFLSFVFKWLVYIS